MGPLRRLSLDRRQRHAHQQPPLRLRRHHQRFDHSGIAAQFVYYNVDEHEGLLNVVSQFDGITIRISPGQITANGGNGFMENGPMAP